MSNRRVRRYVQTGLRKLELELETLNDHVNVGLTIPQVD